MMSLAELTEHNQEDLQLCYKILSQTISQMTAKRSILICQTGKFQLVFFLLIRKKSLNMAAYQSFEFFLFCLRCFSAPKLYNSFHTAKFKIQLIEFHNTLCTFDLIQVRLADPCLGYVGEGCLGYFLSCF